MRTITVDGFVATPADQTDLREEVWSLAPPHVALDLDEALELLAVLEDARETMKDGGHLSGVVLIEDQVRMLSRRLGFDDPEGEADAD